MLSYSSSCLKSPNHSDSGNPSSEGKHTYCAPTSQKTTSAIPSDPLIFRRGNNHQEAALFRDGHCKSHNPFSFSFFICSLNFPSGMPKIQTRKQVQGHFAQKKCEVKESPMHSDLNPKENQMPNSKDET